MGSGTMLGPTARRRSVERRFVTVVGVESPRWDWPYGWCTSSPRTRSRSSAGRSYHHFGANYLADGKGFVDVFQYLY